MVLSLVVYFSSVRRAQQGNSDFFLINPELYLYEKDRIRLLNGIRVFMLVERLLIVADDIAWVL